MTPSGSSPRGRGKREEPARRRNRRWLIPARAGKTASSCRARVDRAAHPRAGGENAEHRADPVDESGSSPRGRGKRGAVVVSQSRNAAHPRAGGENLINAGVEVLNAGSSPRGRGKRKSRRCGRRRRLIPARAGKTERAPTSARPRPAHPRAGGENSRMITGRGMQAGSSPRGRGKRQIDTPASRRRGLIPARAGKTCRCRHPHRAAPAHPRAGGENPGAWWLPVVAGGSSPRGRGKPSVSGDGHFLSGSSPRGRGKLANAVPGASGKRLIPARAGKTGPRAGQRSREAAHPRAGGENALAAVGVEPVEGSSPRGRGKQTVWRAGKHRVRLIPARAGKTGSWSNSTPASWAHPRAGGENDVLHSIRRRSRGSSPRGRGKLVKADHDLVSGRLIPARAGKTF